MQYKIGQLYMISKHSHQQSDSGEGVEVVKNEPCVHPVHGTGQYTEKKIHLFGSVLMSPSCISYDNGNLM